MRRFYSVIACYYDDGSVSAVMGTAVVSNRKPDNTWRETSLCDIYVDWFETKAEAARFMKGELG